MTAERSGFRTTRWSLVRRAQAGDAAGRQALEELCQVYWPAVYGFLRRYGIAAGEAEDLTQALFARILERRDLERLDPALGSLRAWLKAAARNAASNFRAGERTLRRGGGALQVSLSGPSGANGTADAARLERLERSLEPAHSETPERAFDRLWAHAALERARERLGAEQQDRGRGALFDELRPWLEEVEQAPPYSQLAARFETTPGALRVLVHRWRQRLGELIVAEVRDTVPEGDNGVDELGALLAALEGRPRGAG